MITGGMDGMLKQTSRKPIKTHKNPKPNQEILLYMVRWGLTPSMSMLFSLVHVSQGFSTWKIFHLLWGDSSPTFWHSIIGLFVPIPSRASWSCILLAVSLFMICFCFLDNMNDPLIIIWTKAIRNWDWGIEVQYLVRKLRKTEIWAGELRLSGKYCSSWVQKLLRLAGIFLFLNSKERAFACSCIYITVWRSQHGELIKKTSQNNHKIFQLLFNHEPFHLVEKWWNCLTRTPLQHIIQFVNY